MRVLLATDWPWAGGGVETYTMMLARGLRAAGDEVRLLASGVGGGAAVADYVAFGSRNPLLQTVLQIANPAAARAMRTAVVEFRPNVVHVGMFEMHLSPSVLSSAGAIPAVISVAYYKPICPNGLKLLPDDALCHVHRGGICWRGGCTSFPHWLRDRPRYARIDRAMRRAAAIVTCSQWMQQSLAEDGLQSRWMEWPVDRPAASLRRSRSGKPLVVYVGRLSREKGVDTLLHALSKLDRHGARPSLRIVGDGPDRAMLAGLAVALGLNDVSFIEWQPVDRIEPLLADAWALVAPSRWAEPLGLTAIEAIVRGVPVVATAIGGLSETVEPGVTGLLFPNGDAEALAACLRDIIANPVWSSLSPDAVERLARRHDPDRHIENMRALFAEIAR